MTTKKETEKQLRKIMEENPECVELIKDSFIANMVGDVEHISKTTVRLKKILTDNKVIFND